MLESARLPKTSQLTTQFAAPIDPRGQLFRPFPPTPTATRRAILRSVARGEAPSAIDESQNRASSAGGCVPRNDRSIAAVEGVLVVSGVPFHGCQCVRHVNGASEADRAPAL